MNVAIGLTSIFATWIIAWLLIDPIGKRFSYSMTGLFIVELIGISGSIFALVLLA